MKSNKITLVTVRLTQEQYDLIDEQANLNERSLGAEIRFQLFGKGDD